MGRTRVHDHERRAAGRPRPDLVLKQAGLHARGVLWRDKKVELLNVVRADRTPKARTASA
jgi:hypothetical protein